MKTIFTEQELKNLKDSSNDNKTVYVQFGRDESEYYFITSIDKSGCIYGFRSDEKSFGVIPEMELLTRSSFKHQNIKSFPLTKVTREMKFNNFLSNTYHIVSDIHKERDKKENKADVNLSEAEIIKAETKTNEAILEELKSDENKVDDEHQQKTVESKLQELDEVRNNSDLHTLDENRYDEWDFSGR